MPDPDNSAAKTTFGTHRARRRRPDLLRSREVSQLIDSATRWIGDAMDAWSDDDYNKVGMLAPLAVEHLGKALLWQTNPVLVVPLSSEAEASLIQLATKPSLADPKLRTVGLKLLLSRVDAATGPLPLNDSRRKRMVEIRNGATHVAAPAQSRHVLIDALTVCNVLLERLRADPASFYGDHLDNVARLVEQGRSEVHHQVDAKAARARKRINQLKDQLGNLFDETVDRFEEEATASLPVMGNWSVDERCPVCERVGRIGGPVELNPDVHEAEGEENIGLYNIRWEATMSPAWFSCNVCCLKLSGVEELSAGGVRASPFEVDAAELGPDVDPIAEAERDYQFEFGPRH